MASYVNTEACTLCMPLNKTFYIFQLNVYLCVCAIPTGVDYCEVHFSV